MPFAVPKLRIIDRYLVRELLASFVAATAILLLVSIGGTVADLLNKIARGRIPAELLFSLIGLRTIDALTILAPLAVFIGVQLAYGRLWRESEMAVFQASGLSLIGLLRPLALLSVPLMLLMALISFWLAPAAVRLSQSLLLEANRSLIIAGLEPGRFVELPNNEGVMYVEGMNEDGTKFKKMFVASERADAMGAKGKEAKSAAATGENATTRINVITASDGELYHDKNGAERYLGLNDGFRVEGVLGEDNYRLLRYARNDLKLSDPDQDFSTESAKRAAPTLDLLRSTDPTQRAEIHWRLAAPISILVLVLLALPLSKSSPRQPRYAGLIVAFLAWAIYYNGITIGRSLLSQGKFSFLLGFWWVHLPVLLVALFLLWRSQRLPRQKRVPVAVATAGVA
ncbi:MAG: LPS export ABC transporter permease LptF [Gammaproteobacteria bacterium]|nr:MAG: LPS export ABC transporter permease LptF [Gammaproteobacteria bacterium]